MTSVYIFHCCLLKVSLHNRHIDLLTVIGVSGTCNLCYSENRGYRSNLQVIGVTNNRNCSVMIKCPSEPWQCAHSGLNDTTMTRSLKLKQLNGIQTSLISLHLCCDMSKCPPFNTQWTTAVITYLNHSLQSGWVSTLVPLRTHCKSGPALTIKC